MICDQANKNLQICDDESYHEADLYDEIISWRALLRESEMLSCHQEIGFARNIYKKPLHADLNDFTENVTGKMKFWDMVAGGQPIQKNMYEYLHVTEEDVVVDLETYSDEE